jgi:hypothetical protein
MSALILDDMLCTIMIPYGLWPKDQIVSDKHIPSKKSVSVP